MKIFSFFVIIILVLESKAAIVKQLLNDQNLAVIELTKNNESALVGDSFIASNETSQCALKVVSIEGLIATTTSSDCVDKSALKVGNKVEKSLFAKDVLNKSATEKVAEPKVDTTPALKTDLALDEQNYFGLSIGYMISPKMKIDIVATNGATSESGYFEYKFSNALRIGFEWSQFKRERWNSGFSVEYANPQFDSYTAYGNASGAASGSLTGGMTLLSISYAGKYRWDKVYLPTVMGITSSSVDSTGILTKTLTTSALFGLGVGFLINDNFALELTSNANTVTGGVVTSGGTTITPSTGYLSNLQISGKFHFR